MPPFGWIPTLCQGDLMGAICQFVGFAADEIVGESFHDSTLGTLRVLPTPANEDEAVLTYGTDFAAERLVKLSVME